MDMFEVTIRRRIRRVGQPRRRGGCALGMIAYFLLLLTMTGCASIREYRARRAVTRGDALLVSDDLQAALAEFQEAAQLAPQLAVAHSKMGLIYRRVGEYEQAIDCFIEAVHHNPSSFEDTIHLARLYHFTQRIKEAIQAYLHAVELKTDDFDAQLNLGVCYQHSGDAGQAAERFRNAIDIDPNRPHAYVNLGVALDAQKKYYEAIAAYKEALERDTRQPLVLVNLANTYMNQERLKLARHALQQAIRMDAKLAAAHEALGYCLFRIRDFPAAEQSYATALECDWRLPHAHGGLGSVYMLRFLEDKTQADLRDRALEHWHHSLEQKPDQPRIRKLIAKYKPQPSRDPVETLLSTHSGR